MMTGYNTKKENTRRYLNQALVELLEEIPIHRVSVSNLTQKAGLSRGTFYLHYVDIEDFLNTRKQGLIDKMKSAVELDAFSEREHEGIRFLVRYVEKHFATFRVLLGPNGDKCFEREIILVFRDIIFGESRKNWRSASIPKEYVMNLSVMSIISILQTWLGEEDPRPSEEIIDIILKTRDKSPYELMEGKI